MKLLQDLISIPSYSGSEEKLAVFIQKYCDLKGIKTLNQKCNIIIHFKGKDKTKCLIFNAHMDTVSAGDRELWKFDPFIGGVEQDKVYGLGASDDKSAIAVLLMLSETLQTNTPKCDVFLAFTANEEIDGQGTRDFIDFFHKTYAKNYKNISAIVCEATDAKYLEIGHRGDLKIKITVFGNSEHSAVRKKINAIEEMIKIIKQVKQLEKNANKKYAHPILGNVSFVLTHIENNEKSLNKTPNSCSTVWDVRTTPSIHKIIIKLLKTSLGSKVKVEKVFKDTGKPAIISKNEKIVKAFQKISKNIMLSVSPGSNDMCFFINSGIPAVSFGPGTKNTIHKENEFTEIKKMQKTLEIYKELVSNY